MDTCTRLLPLKSKCQGRSLKEYTLLQHQHGRVLGVGSFPCVQGRRITLVLEKTSHFLVHPGKSTSNPRHGCSPASYARDTAGEEA